ARTVLFSREDIADLINQQFEACWESLRPVPLVRIDFGNGKVVTRTLHGNIATYVCTAEGQVLDILPGIYTPTVYGQRMSELALLARSPALRDAGKRSELMKNYHEAQVALLESKAADPVRKVQSPAPQGAAGQLGVLGTAGGGLRTPGGPFASGGFGKFGIEGSLKVMIAQPRTPTGTPTANNSGPPSDEVPKFDRAEDLADWKALALDTRANENTRRLQIHRMLASAGAVRPPQVTRQLFKEVLHADLDDPYLGLGETLF